MRMTTANAMGKHKITIYRILPLLLFLVAGCATVPKTRVTRVYLKDLCDRHNVQWLWDSVSLVITLNHGRFEAKALTGSDIVIMGTERISLSGPVVREKRSIVVPPDFERKIIYRLIQEKAIPFPRVRPYTIVIDAGHGGKDPGSIGKTGLREKKVVLDISRRLEKNLKQEGFNVAMTRREDKFISLAKRTEFTSRSRADLFISVHANSSPVRSVNGVEVFSHRALGKKEKQEDQRRKNHNLLFSRLAMKRNYPVLEETLSDMLYRYKQSRSWIAASYVVKGVSREVRARDRGTKKSSFFVLRNTLIPAVLVEVGFLSNRREEKLLKASSYRQKIADALTRSIVKYVNR